MAEFHVIRFRDQKREGPLLVEAQSAEEAAILACGTPVANRGSRACAEVYPANGSPYGLLTFYWT